MEWQLKEHFKLPQQSGLKEHTVPKLNKGQGSQVDEVVKQTKKQKTKETISGHKDEETVANASTGQNSLAQWQSRPIRKQTGHQKFCGRSRWLSRVEQPERKQDNTKNERGSEKTEDNVHQMNADMTGRIFLGGFVSMSRQSEEARGGIG